MLFKVLLAIALLNILGTANANELSGRFVCTAIDVSTAKRSAVAMDLDHSIVTRVPEGKNPKQGDSWQTIFSVEVNRYCGLLTSSNNGIECDFNTVVSETGDQI